MISRRNQHTPQRRRLPFWALLLIGALTTNTPSTRADELLLVHGGRIRGKWLNAGEENPSAYVFKTEAGARIQIEAAQVRQAHATPAKIADYKRQVPKFGDTPDAQWRLAEWCRIQGLKEQRRVHLERVLHLAPNHADARRALGYSQVDGAWVTQQSFFRDRGYQLYRGRWLSPQEIELLKRDAAAQRKEKAWYLRLKRARKLLADGPNMDALRTFQAARDPSAIYGLFKLWGKEQSPVARRLYVESLAKIQSPAAVASLANIALSDPDLDVFYACMKRLKQDAAPDVVDLFVKALDNANNARVNRAAAALAEFRDPSTIEALIAALVTTHSYVVGSGSPDKMTSTFASGPGGGGSAFTAGDQRKVLRERIPNEGVLTALVAITGQSFGFNQQAWTGWWANRRAILHANAQLAP